MGRNKPPASCRQVQAGRHAWLMLSLCCCLLLGACSINRSAVLQEGASDVDADALAEQAEAAFARTPRTPENVRDAYRLMRAAASGSRADHPDRYEFLYRSAEYAIWLARNADGDVADLASKAIRLCNTAVQADSARVEGYYYRAIAASLVARADRLKGRAAMRSIRTDARQAARLDSTFDFGGPHRVLGALYLRAPGPPTGVGSTRRALHHLREAYRIAPDYPGNRLFLAEALIENDRREEAAELLRNFQPIPAAYGEAEDWERWRKHAQDLRRQLNASG